MPIFTLSRASGCNKAGLGLVAGVAARGCPGFVWSIDVLMVAPLAQSVGFLLCDVCELRESTSAMCHGTADAPHGPYGMPEVEKAWSSRAYLGLLCPPPGGAHLWGEEGTWNHAGVLPTFSRCK
jgi:hypothetical protein